ncbi:MAG: alpha/beta hydrolase, partial [Gammaproteobacteria bacterium]|nr:alpha/beta hydrolase [Gammaproteobacteria bacterium]
AAESSYKEDIAVLVADSSFTSFREITREKLSNHWLTWLFQWPLAMTVEDDYRPIDEISKLHPTAVILVHSKADLVVPFHHGESLYNTAREPKNFWVTQNSVHNGFFSKLENQTALARRIKVWFK